MKRIIFIIALATLCCNMCLAQVTAKSKNAFMQNMVLSNAKLGFPLNSDQVMITNNKAKDITRWIYQGLLPKEKSDLESCIYGWFPVGSYYMFYYNEETDIQDDMTSDFNKYLAIFDDEGTLKDTLHIFKTFNLNYSTICKSFYIKSDGNVLVMTLSDTPEVERIRNIVKPNSYYNNLPPDEAKKKRLEDNKLQSKLTQGKSDNPKTRYEIVEYSLDTQTGKFKIVKEVERGFLDDYTHMYTYFEENSPLYKYKGK